MRLRIVPAVCLLTLTACGGGGDPSSPAADAPSTTAAAPTTTAPAAEETPPVALDGEVSDRGTGDATGGTVALDLGDFYFDPTFVKGKAGSKVTVSLTNSGQAPHTFTVDKPAVDVMVAVGGKGTATVTLPASGTLAFYCKLHKAQGMQGGFYS